MNVGDPSCQYGVEVSKSFKGKAEIEFGRAAKPGEMYMTSPGEANAPGEELAGVTYRTCGSRRSRSCSPRTGVKVDAYLNTKTELVDGVTTAKDVDPAPADWYVDSIQPHSPGVVMVWIGAEPAK